MEKVYCKKDYQFFEEGKIYYQASEKLWSGGTYSLMINIYDMNHNKVGEIGYLYDEIFESLKERRKRIINNLIN